MASHGNEPCDTLSRDLLHLPEDRVAEPLDVRELVVHLRRHARPQPAVPRDDVDLDVLVEEQRQLVSNSAACHASPWL